MDEAHPTPYRLSPLLRGALATAAFSVLHSALATHGAKEVAAKACGPRGRDGTYRLFYNAQAVLSFGALVIYLSRLPKETLYEAKGPARVGFRLGQVASLAFFGWALAELGVKRMSGFRNFAAWARGQEIPVGPAAQGPELNPDGALSEGRAYRYTRHPLNIAMTALFWLTPTLTTGRLGFNAVSTLYFYLGSFHEEHRLRALYGKKYEGYRTSGVPFFWPGRARRTALGVRPGATPIKED
jgi:hypothetical protein